MEGSTRRLSLHWTALAEGNANVSIVIVFGTLTIRWQALNTERKPPE